MSPVIQGYLFDLSAFFTAASIFLAAIMWALLWRYKFAIPVWDVARIFSVAFTLQLLIYLVFSFLVVNIFLRAYLVRTSIVVICLSQAIPLLVAYRDWHHEQRSH